MLAIAVPGLRIRRRRIEERGLFPWDIPILGLGEG